MSSLNLFSLDDKSLISVPFFGGVKVRCCVVARPLSVLVHIYDGRHNRFCTRRFTSNSFADVADFTSFLDSIKHSEPSLQSYAIACFLASIAIETLSAKSIVRLFITYLPTYKD